LITSGRQPLGLPLTSFLYRNGLIFSGFPLKNAPQRSLSLFWRSLALFLG
jgi:hypothetical protein